MLTPLKLVIFLGSTAGMIYVSRVSLRSFRSHGFSRFFAWEAILVLFLINVDVWFYEPFSFHQITSWLCLIISTFLVIHSTWLLHVLGKPDKNRNDSSLFRIEKTTVIVKEGVYKYIRHPIYSSLLFLAWGIFLKSLSWLTVVFVVLATVFLIATAKVEEIENMQYFGEAYHEYMKQTKLFIPFLY